MKERPILLSGPMVRALLAGTKAQTRRVVKAKHLPWLESSVLNFLDGKWNQRPLPYGQPGDRLWVREAWHAARSFNSTPPRDIPTDSAIEYAATARSYAEIGLKGKLRPSMFMPRWASRITLEITSVRVERLQDISPNDCIAEGAWPVAHRELGRGHEAVAAYQALWESINGPGSWDANPWVWVVDFRRIEAEGGAT